MKSRTAGVLSPFPGGVGSARGVGAILRKTCSVWSRAPGNGVTRVDRVRLEPELRGGGSAVRGLLRGHGALPSDEVPPSRRSGAAYSQRTGSAASARAVTTSLRPMPGGPLLGARVHDRDVAEPRLVDGALEVAAVARRALDEEHARGRAAPRPARSPASPLPRRCRRSTSRPRSSGRWSADRESATWRSTASNGIANGRGSGRIRCLQEQQPRERSTAPASSP